LIKTNLDFSKLRIENSEGNEQLVIVPIKEQFKMIKHVDAKTVVNLLIVLDQYGNIRKGNLVLFIPDNGEPSIIPDNTFYAIFNTAEPKCNGNFHFLSVSGRLLYQLNYENKKLRSAGIVKNKEGNISGRTMGCIDWYLVTTYYYDDGTTSTEEEYLGRTCDGCDDPNLQSICPDDGNGGNGGGLGETEYEYEATREQNWEVYPGPNRAWGVYALDRLKGKRNSSEPGGGHFTGITSISADCISCASYSVTWNWDYKNATFSGATASCIIRGHLTTPTNPDIFVNQTHNYSFLSVFP
jgi:hypothetical protein